MSNQYVTFFLRDRSTGQFVYSSRQYGLLTGEFSKAGAFSSVEACQKAMENMERDRQSRLDMAARMEELGDAGWAEEFRSRHPQQEFDILYVAFNPNHLNYVDATEASPVA